MSIEAESNPENPYEAPETASDPVTMAGGMPLAGRGSRLAAVLLDSVFGMISVMPGGILIAIAFATGAPTEGEVPTGALLIIGVLLLLVGMLGLVVYQLYLLTVSGQTLGKRLLNVRVVSYDDGSNPGFVRVVLLRGFVNGILGSIPYLGMLYNLTDALFIFGIERRCVHDHLAGTKVVEV